MKHISTFLEKYKNHFIDETTFNQKLVSTLYRLAKEKYEGDVVELMFDIISFVEKK